MRFMVFVPASEQSEAGALPPDDLINEMNKFNEQLSKAGVLLDLGGLAPTSKGARIKYAKGTTTVTDGPFTEAKELVAGYWLLECGSKEECIEWMKKAPFGGGTELEIRALQGLDDFEPGPGVERAKALERELARK
jgi:hypothetical protein